VSLRRPALALAAAMLALPPVAEAQNFATPSVHWGAMSWPALEPSEILAVNLDRFTEFDNSHVRYNAYDSTVGINFLSFSRTRRLGRLRTTMYRASLAAGWAGNEPTLFLQNNFLHGIRRLKEVPVEGEATGVLGGVALDVVHWVPTSVAGAVPFAEAGATASLVSSDLWVAAGWRAPRLGVSGLVRAGLPLGGKVFPDRYLTEQYVLATVSLRLPTDDVFDRISAGIIPEIEVAYTWSSGYFRRADGRGFIEGFCSLRLTWGVAAFETWNDLCRNKDRGPTYGARLIIDARSLHPSKRP
jgi:hypothetical protein